MAEVFALDEERVVKLDRPEWSGVSEFEEHVLRVMHDAGLPVPCPRGPLTINGRCGFAMDRIRGVSLTAVIDVAAASELDGLAEQFAKLHCDLNSVVVPGLPDLVARLGTEIERSGLPPQTSSELVALLHALDDHERHVSHFDLHPDNVLVTSNGWVVIDWLGAASGPTSADFARTLILRADATGPSMATFVRAVRRHGQQLRGIDGEACTAWARVVAAARLSEDLDRTHTDRLRDIAMGSAPLLD